ncbi:MAG: hypothetical protein RIQ79_1279 [Verrucomicrobiota bacterium]|jgi:hypothetical protein
MPLLFGAEPPPSAQVTAIWIDGRGPASEYFVTNAKGQPQKLAVGAGSRGAPVSVGAVGQSVVILRKAAAPATSGAATYEPAGEIAWPAGGSRKILLLLAAGMAPSKTVSPPVKGMALADDFTGFPVGTLKITNFLNSELFGRVGDAMRPIPPGVSPVVPYPVTALPPGEKRAQNFALGFARNIEGGRTDLFYNGRVDAWPHSRTLVLILPGQNAKDDPVVRTIFDVVPPPPPNAPPGVRPR